ncbi:MAG: efflux RND transporter periplasmic adaptor subunit [Planctomycetota bacterium]
MRLHAPQSPSGGRGAVRAGLMTVLLLGAGGGLLWWRGADGAAARDALDSDRIVVVESRDVIDSVNASGRVEPLARVAVMSRASGIIEALYVDEGDVVESGQVLAELDREQLQAQLEQDEADRLAASARLDAAKARLDEARVRVSDPELEFLRREVKRLDGLFEVGDVSVKEHEDAARALALAEFRVDLVEAGIPVLQAAVAEAEAGLAAADAALARSETFLREATILCPIDGVVLTRDKEVGDGVSSILTAGGNATQILTLGDLSRMHIEARVDEVDLGRIRVGMPALVTVDAHRDKPLDGAVRRIAPAGSIDDNGIVTFEVEVSVQDPESILRPDMTADAKLVIDRRDGVSSLPQIALARSEDGVWNASRVVGSGDEARVERVAVQLGLSDGLMTEVTDGLTAGDRVLLPPARRAGER